MSVSNIFFLVIFFLGAVVSAILLAWAEHQARQFGWVDPIADFALIYSIAGCALCWGAFLVFLFFH